MKKWLVVTAVVYFFVLSGVAYAEDAPPEIDLLGKIDKTPPVITDVLVSGLGTDTATITWTTDEVADSLVRYGIAPHVSERAQQSTFVLLHSVVLTGLDSGAGYSFCVGGRDMSNNNSDSCDYSFSTDPIIVTDTTAPVISDLQVTDIGTSTAAVTWMTDEIAQGQVEYGTTTAYGSVTAASVSLDIQHYFALAELQPSTTYHVRALARDDSGNVSESEDMTFVTNALPVVVTPPEPEVPPVVIPPPVAPPPTPTPEPIIITSGGGGGGGIIGSGAPTAGPVPGKVQNVAAYGLDRTVILTWRKPGSDFTSAEIVRSDTKYPTAPQEGTLVYSGSGRIFTDINLTNDKTYYYSIFAHTTGSGNATPVELSIAPVSDPTTYSTVRVGAGKINILTTKDFGIGTRGAVVEYLQKLLATDPALYPEGLVTGYFGPMTEAALKRFQAANNIPATGVVDANVRAVAQNLPLLQQSAAGARSTGLMLGSRGENVKVLQIALVQFGYLTDDSITSYFGPLTQAAVAKFQSDNAITPAVGYFGPLTRAKMFEKTSH